MATALTGPISTFGADPYTDWVAVVKGAGGTATAWPFSKGIYGGYYGRPAAKYSNAAYVRAANGHVMPNADQPQQSSASGQFVYVLADRAVAAAAPATMNWLQKAANEAFTIGDIGAAAVGLPSLASIENFLKSLGTDAIIIAGVAGLAWYLINRRGD